MKKVKTLQNKALRLWKEICFLRDGRECQVKKDFPFIRITHTNILQIDHCISRGNKHFFIDTRNGTVVCSACNYTKKFKLKSIDRAVDYIVKKRVGKVQFQAMVALDQTMEPNHNWSQVWYLEDEIEKLEKEKQQLLQKVDM